VSDELPAAVPVAETGTEASAEVPGLETSQIAPDQLAPSDPSEEQDTSRLNAALRDILSGSAVLTILAIFAALVISGVLIAATDPDVQAAAGYFLARPSDTLIAIWQSVSGAYAAIFRGGVYDFTAPTFSAGIDSFLTSISFATPLIAAGLGVAVGFRSGVFNIGGTGIILVSAAAAGWVGFALNMPPGIHVIVAILAGLVAGGFWAFIVGFLKARTGAHEVIVTIMLNYVALYLIDYLLNSPVLRAPGSNAPISPPEKGTAVFMNLLGDAPALNVGFLLVIAITIFCWWLLSRSSLGFKFRAVGENPRAARVAGIRINRMYIYVMTISGLLIAFAGVYQVLGQITSGFDRGIDSGIGFAAITVALLGRSRPGGVFAAGILFGVLQAGSYTMQASQGVNVNIIPVIESVIVLFLAAPPLVRAIFRTPAPGSKPKPKKPNQQKATSEAVTAK
jgi:general nucleoside transport system permease protein